MAGPLFRVVLWAFLLCSGAVFAQEKDQSLADIRQDLGVLYIEIQKLKRELSTTQLPSGLQSGDSVLERVNAIELELQRLTGATEQLDHRLKRVVEDGTNRIGDLEFRLIELEGGDISNLADTTTLGGESEPQEQTVPIEAPPELAVGEEADFDLAQSAFDAENYVEAAEMLSRFSQTYPDSPLIAEAHLLRGKAFEAVEDYKASARAYLESYNALKSPDALQRLSNSLISLGQMETGCQMLSQVELLFPGTSYAAVAQSEMQRLQCF